MLQEPGAIHWYFHILQEAPSRAGISIPVASGLVFREDLIASRMLTGLLGKGLARRLLPSSAGSPAQLLDPIHVSSHHWKLVHTGPKKKRRSPKKMDGKCSGCCRYMFKNLQASVRSLGRVQGRFRIRHPAQKLNWGL